MTREFRTWMDERIEWTIPHRSKHKQARIILRAGLLTACFMAYYFMVSYIVEFKLGMWIESVLTILFSLIPVAIIRRINLNVVGNVFILLGCLGIFLLTLFTGGLTSPVLPWISLVPIVALLFVNRLWVWVWFGITIGIVLLIIYREAYAQEILPQYNLEYKTFLFANCMIGLVVTILFLNMIFEYSLRQANQQLELKNIEIEEKNKLLETQAAQITRQRDEIIDEKKKSDDLLLNILPDTIAEELKKSGSCEARQYDNVSILFTDFVNFTQSSERIDPKHLIAALHRYFLAFDSIIEKHGLEKIKTIGDAYMAVSGLPNINPDHAIRAARAALDINAFIEQSLVSANSSDHLAFQARIGIHTGPVIAGIVGSKKFAYDIWGDAVNTAARIEQHGVAQKICVSGATYELIKNQFNCEYRGKITSKHKGELDMYFVNSERINE